MAKIIIIAGNARSLIANRGDLVHALLNKGHSITALVPEFDNIQEMDSFDVPYELIKLDRRHMNPFKDLLACNELRKTLIRLKPDLVFSYTIKPVVYGTLAAKLAGVHRITSMITGLGHLFSGKSFKQRFGRYFARSLYAIAFSLNNVVFFQNPDDLREIGSLGPFPLCKKTMVVAGSGVNMNRFSRQPIKSNFPLRFLLISRILKNKGVVEFCEAAMILHSEFPEVEFVVVGPHDPTLPSAIPIDQLSSYKSSGAVSFLAATKDVRPYLAECSVFVLPSTYREGTPRAILEAMATGRGIITTDMPGCRKTVIHGENGFLVQPGDVTSLVEAMRKIINDTSLIKKMGDRSFELAKTVYDVNIVNKQIMENFFPEDYEATN